MANMSDGQLLRTMSHTTGAADQSVNEKIMRQLSDLQAKYTESQLALAEAIKHKQGWRCYVTIKAEMNYHDGRLIIAQLGQPKNGTA